MKAKHLFSALLIAFLIGSTGVKAQWGCSGRTYPQATWGQNGGGGNNMTGYLVANFSSAFPSGLTIGCTNQLVLTSGAAIANFLPSTGGVATLPTGTMVNPGSTYNNQLAGELVALTLNVGFDNWSPTWSPSPSMLGTSIITFGPFTGMTVNQF